MPKKRSEDSSDQIIGGDEQLKKKSKSSSDNDLEVEDTIHLIDSDDDIKTAKCSICEEVVPTYSLAWCEYCGETFGCKYEEVNKKECSFEDGSYCSECNVFSCQYDSCPQENNVMSCEECLEMYCKECGDWQRCH